MAAEHSDAPFRKVDFSILAQDLGDLARFVEAIADSARVNPYWILKSKEALSRLSIHLNDGNIATLDVPSDVRDCLEGIWATISIHREWTRTTQNVADPVVRSCLKSVAGILAVDVETVRGIAADLDAGSSSERNSGPATPVVDPLQTFTRRLRALVRSRLDWWREAVERWANDPPLHGDDGVLPVPFPNTLTPDERVAILAAIHDSCTTDVARIDPWSSREVQSLECADAVSGEHQAAIRYDFLLTSRVPKLREHWETHEAAIEMFVAETERDLSDRGSRAAQHQNGGGLIERLLAGPDDLELTPSELAFLEAYMNQTTGLATVEREPCSQSIDKAETCNRLRKLTLLRDFNRQMHTASSVKAQLLKVQAACDEPATPTVANKAPKRRGRKKADYETEKKEENILEKWERAKESGIRMKDFVRDLSPSMSLKDFDRLITRVRKRLKRKSRAD